MNVHMYFLFICAIMCMPSAHRGQKKAANSMELELTISCHMDAENQTQAF